MNSNPSPLDALATAIGGTNFAEAVAGKIPPREKVPTDVQKVGKKKYLKKRRNKRRMVKASRKRNRK